MTQRAGYLFISCPGLDDADALRRRAQLLASDQGHQARERRLLRGRPGRTPARARPLHRRRGVRLRGDAGAARDDSSSSPASACTCRPTCPHWVETEAGVSISFSIPFYTSYTERAEGVSRINRRLRRLHLSPRPLGASESVDKTKAAVIPIAGCKLHGGAQEAADANGSRSQRHRDAAASRRTWRYPSRHSYRESNVYVCVPSMPGIQSASIRPTGVSR